MTPAESALHAARAILSTVRGPELPGGEGQLLAQIQCIVRDAITASRSDPLPELFPGADARVQQSLAVIDQARLHREERERAANDRRQEERRGWPWPQQEVVK